VQLAPAAGEPLVSIVIPVYNAWAYTNACLRALAETLDPAIPFEVVVVDDGSTDETAALLARCSGIVVVTRAANEGFAAAANAGAAAARGRIVHFLNNDAVPSAGWLPPLLDVFTNPDVGAAVSQLRFAGDTLAEAGGVIWSDARGSNYGRGGDPSDWRYRSLRDADYGSAASLMVRRDAFAAAGGFSTEFAPAYYEDVDLCFALRARGLRVLYQPASIVYHAEGASYGSNLRPEARARQERSRERFARKWAAALRECMPPEPATIDAAARRLAPRGVVLVADRRVPFGERDAGSARIGFVVEALQAQGYRVVFATLESEAYEPFAAALRARGVDVVTGFSGATAARLAAARLPVTLAWLSRPETASALEAHVRAGWPGARIVFDTVDLHYVRLEREQAVTGRRTGWRAMKSRELALARGAGVAVVTSTVELGELQREGIAAALLSVVQRPLEVALEPWERRSGIVFLGNYGHAPNVDAATWFCREIAPLVWQREPDAVVTLAGADPPRAVRALAGPRVAVPAFTEDIDALLARRRVFVAPLRFGAGVKAKVLHAMAAGLPVVATPVGAEGIFEDGCGGTIAAAPAEFARATLRFYRDRAAWNAAVAGAPAILQRFSAAAAAAALAAITEPSGRA